MERALLGLATEDDAATALVGSALNDDNAELVEFLCVQAGTRAVRGSSLLGLAGLCLGHAARRFGSLSTEAFDLAQSLATRAELDPSDVDPRAIDGLTDVRRALGR